MVILHLPGMYQQTNHLQLFILNTITVGRSYNTRHTVKNVFLYELIFIDVTNSGGFDRWNYTGISYTLFFILIQVSIHVHDQSLIEIG